MIKKETTERSDNNNWVKNKLLANNFKIIDFEGYTVKNNKVTGLFDRMVFSEIDFNNLSIKDIENIIRGQEPNLSSKILFAKSLDVAYRYVFYSYDPEILHVYRFNDNLLEFKISYNNFCDFINDTKRMRDLVISSQLQEDRMPEIDKIFRNRCQYPWMGNLDGIFLSNDNKPKALVEFQTTIKTPVKYHCNNTWFTPKNGRKGDEQRWRVFNILAKQSNLPLVIIVWSPKEINGDIKYKIVEDIIYSNDTHNREPGLIYSSKDVIDYNELCNRLSILING